MHGAEPCSWKPMQGLSAWISLRSRRFSTNSCIHDYTQYMMISWMHRNNHTIDKDHITFLHYLEWIETTHRINPEQALPLESAVIMFNSWQHATYHINKNADTGTIQEWMVKNRRFHIQNTGSGVIGIRVNVSPCFPMHTHMACHDQYQ